MYSALDVAITLPVQSSGGNLQGKQIPWYPDWKPAPGTDGQAIILNDGQNPDLSPRCQLVIHEVHRPDIVRLDSFRTTLPKLRFQPPLRRLVPELHAQLLVNAIGLLPINLPALALQQHVDTPISEPDTDLTNLFDSLFQL